MNQTHRQASVANDYINLHVHDFTWGELLDVVQVVFDLS